MNILRPLTYTAGIFRDAFFLLSAVSLAWFIAYVMWSMAFGLAQAL